MLVGVADSLALLKLFKIAFNRLGEPEFDGVGALLPDEVAGDDVGVGVADLVATVTEFAL